MSVKTMWMRIQSMELGRRRTTHRLSMRARYRRGPIYTAIFIMVFGRGIGWLVAVAADRCAPWP